MSLVEDLGIVGQTPAQGSGSLVEDLGIVGGEPETPAFNYESGPSTWEDVKEAIRSGMVQSPTGAILYGDVEPYQPRTTAGQVAEIASNLGQTIPYFMAGAQLGELATPVISAMTGAAPQAAGPLAATAGAFVLPRVVEEVAKQFHAGKLSYSDLVSAVGEELAKSIVFHKAGKVGEAIGERLGKTAAQVGRLGLEGTSLAFLANPGSLPTGRDVAQSVATLAALGIAGATGSKVLKLAVRGVDVKKLAEAAEDGTVDKVTVEELLDGKVPTKVVDEKLEGGTWQRMSEFMLKVNAERGVKEARAELERRAAERKAERAKVKEEIEKTGKPVRSEKKTKDKRYLGKTAEYKKLLGPKVYYEVMENLGIRKSNEVNDPTSKKLVLEALRKKAEELKSPPAEKKAESKKWEVVEEQSAGGIRTKWVVTPDRKIYVGQSSEGLSDEQLIERAKRKLKEEAAEQPTSGRLSTKAEVKPSSGRESTKATVKQKVKLKETGQVVTVERDAKEVFKETHERAKRYEEFMRKLDKFKDCMGW